MTCIREMKQKKRDTRADPPLLDAKENEIKELTLTLAETERMQNFQEKVTKKQQTRMPSMIIVDMMQWARWSITDAHRVNRRTPSRMPISREKMGTRSRGDRIASPVMLDDALRCVQSGNGTIDVRCPAGRLKSRICRWSGEWGESTPSSHTPESALYRRAVLQ